MKKIVTRCFIGILIFFMVSILLCFFTKNVLIEKLHMKNSFTKLFFNSPTTEEPETEEKTAIEADTIDWEELYPFSDMNTDNGIKEITVFADYRNTILTAEYKIEDYTKGNLVNRMKFVESAAKYENFIGWHLLNEYAFDYNGGIVFDLGDGHLTQVLGKIEVFSHLFNSNGITTPAAAVYELSDFLASLGIDFLYVQIPHKISKEDKIAGLKDFSNANADELLEALSLKHIPYLDLRENIRQVNLDHHSLFYKTDHHWKAETGLWATGIIAEYLNINNGFNINLDLLKPEQYRYDIYKNYFLGSWGRKVTLAQTQPEDISLIYPKFDTNISLKLLSRGVDANGTFEILYDYRQVKEIDYYNRNPYGAYLYGDNALTIIHNNLLYDNKKILIILDSFGISVAPFLSLGIENVDVLDLRFFTGSVKTYITQNNPDMVIVMYNPSSIGPPDNTHTSTFDFR